jgi:hypothetical protein
MAESLENEALFLEGLAMVMFCSDVQAWISELLFLSGTLVELFVKKNGRNSGVWIGFENGERMRRNVNFS